MDDASRRALTYPLSHLTCSSATWIARGVQYLFGSGGRRSTTSRLGLFDDSGRGTAPVSSTDGGGYIPRYDDGAGRSTAPGLYSSAAFGEPLFGTRSRDSLIDEEDRHGDEAFLFQEQHMPRSHSAAPLLRETKSLGPPPGYLMNRTSAIDAVPQMQRSASTGVIGGGQQKSSSSVLHSLGLDSDGADLGSVSRPAPKTLMDLIQEDFPSSPSPYSEYSSHSRPRTASPPSQYNRMDNRMDNGRYGMEQQERISRMDNGRYGMEQQVRVAYSQQDQVGDITHSMDHMRLNTRDGYAVSTVVYGFSSCIIRRHVFLTSYKHLSIVSAARATGHALRLAAATFRKCARESRAALRLCPCRL